MTIPYRGTARVPGPLGVLSNGGSGHTPGPIGTLWQKKTTQNPPSQVKASGKRTVMPGPANDNTGKNVHAITWPLYGSKKTPVHTDVKQSPHLANCPVASILAALAFTQNGRTLLQAMVSETQAATITDVSGLDADTLATVPAGGQVKSARYFTVKLPGGTREVSDVLYTTDHDQGWSPIYMRDPSEAAIWCAVIEKALAVQLGSYEQFDASNLSANDFWEKIVGKKPGGFAITKDTDLNQILKAAKAATGTATIGASKDSGTDTRIITEFHGFAMLGVENNKIKLYDPAKTKTFSITPQEFRQNFQAILFQT